MKFIIFTVLGIIITVMMLGFLASFWNHQVVVTPKIIITSENSK